MNIIDIIEKVKRRERLSREAIRFFVNGVTKGIIPDYQTSALLMAVCINGLDDDETTELTLAMAESGDMLDLSSVGRPVVDKHSTGGIGDKTTIILGPILAALGVPVAKMSGRGLGITGGTIDKLESIPGFNTEVSNDEFIKLIKDVGFVAAAQTISLAPADKILYALRDVTGTVDSIPLIASSIMSKKLALGTNCIVLDVKYGNGAFMKDYDNAKKLADIMCNIGRNAGRKMSAVLSDMNQPLGYAIGNRLEIEEAIDYLTDKKIEKGLEKVINELCIEMYKLSDKYAGEDEETLKQMIRGVIEDGSAFDVFKRFVEIRGGNLETFISPEREKHYEELLSSGRLFKKEIELSKDIDQLSAELVGRASLMLGAGRNKKDDAIDPYAGILFLNKPDDLKNDEMLKLVLYSGDAGKIEEVLQTHLKMFIE